MGWETIVKRAKRKDTITAEIDSDFTALAGLGRFFMDMGGIDREDIWRYIEKPYKWQPEYELTVKLAELLDIDDLGELEDYMLDKSLYFFDQPKIFICQLFLCFDRISLCVIFETLGGLPAQ